ncbi:MAG: sporulation protein YqfD [Oscillospiraceae bacterium]
MLVLNVFRLFKGYVNFKAEGGFIERFLNLLAQNNVAVWNIKRYENYICGNVTYGEFEKICRYGKKCGVAVTKQEEVGSVKYINRYKKRIGFVVGIVIFWLCLMVSSIFIWEISIEGNEKVPTHQIAEYLEDLGIKKGRLSKFIDTKRIEDEIKTNIKDIDWIGVNIRGSKVDVKVKETINPPELISKEPSNAIADKDGVVKYIEIYSGTPVVEEGTVVKKGDILVSGIISDNQSHTYLKNARCKVIAQTNETKVFEKKLADNVLIQSGKTINNKYMNIFGKEIPFISNKKISCGGYERQFKENLRLGKMKLPFTVTVKQFIPFEKQKIKISEKKAQELVQIDMLNFELAKGKHVSIIKRDAKGKIENGTFVCTVDYVFEENIAKEQKILQNSSNTD